MIRKCAGIIVLATVAGLPGQDAAAQGFAVGQTVVGPVVGLGGLGESSLSLGVRFERGILDVPDLGDGVIGIQAGLDFYSYSYSVYGVDLGTFRYIPVGVTANYHFNTESDRIDPFVGLGVGYTTATCDGCGTAVTSPLYAIGRAGIRYSIERLALYADVGVGEATVHAGVMFQFP